VTSTLFTRCTCNKCGAVADCVLAPPPHPGVCQEERDAKPITWVQLTLKDSLTERTMDLCEDCAQPIRVEFKAWQAHNWEKLPEGT
jgi:hypothetical protein